MGWGGEDGFKMIQAHCIYCALYFSYYYISSTLGHQTLDPGVCVCVCVRALSRSVASDSLQPHGL